MRVGSGLVVGLVLVSVPAGVHAQAQLTSVEKQVVAYIDAHEEQSIELLRKIVDINSGTLNPAGVKAVADALAPEFEALGFDVRYEPLPDSLGRGGHFIAERRGERGPRLLLIGHLDTVFERDSPFQEFERIDSVTAAGPGVNDMKGGDIAMLAALQALHAEGLLEGTTFRVVLTGDEERPGQPVSVARAALIEAGRSSDIALGFEGGSRGEDVDYGVVGRRSASSWQLEVTGRRAHSSGVFSEDVGAGAIYEAARILDAFYTELREDGLTYNPGMIVGGSEATLTAEAQGRAAGKTNVVAERAVVQGDIRTLTDEQLTRTRDAMRAIVGRSLPGTRARITFQDGYPAMEATEGNRDLLRRFDEVSRALGLPRVEAFDPARRGAADISFVAPYVAGLDGLGVLGPGSHTVEERIELPSLTMAAKRAAILIHRLTRTQTATQ